MSRLSLVVLLAALAGCAVPSTAERDLARAQRADSLGDTWAAFSLYRAAARGGSLDAQIHLAESPSSGPYPLPITEALVSPRPDRDEKRMWRSQARATARRLADAGDPNGHIALAHYALTGDTPGHGLSTAQRLAEARRHYEAAVRLGSASATFLLALNVNMTDGLLAAEPYFRASYDAGNHRAAMFLEMAAMNRPYLERGVDPRDAAGDLSQMDYVGSHRVMRSLPDPQSQRLADDEVRDLHKRAQTGDAVADSLLRAFDAADLLG